MGRWNHRRRALKRAGRVGFAAYLAVLLTSSLFAAPVIATHLDFAHTHPEGTEPHVHDVGAVLTPAAAVPVATVPDVRASVVAPVRPGALVAVGNVVDRANPVRAPPTPS